jgi:hypothetical protein
MEGQHLLEDPQDGIISSKEGHLVTLPDELFSCLVVLY